MQRQQSDNNSTLITLKGKHKNIMLKQKHLNLTIIFLCLKTELIFYR